MYKEHYRSWMVSQKRKIDNKGVKNERSRRNQNR
jgi:hypothetical protein